MVRIAAVLATFTVLAGGVFASAAAATPRADPTPAPPPSQALVLAFDTSDSVEQQQFEDAKAAVVTVLTDLVDQGVPVGLVAFGDTAEVLVRPGEDPGRIAPEIQGLTKGAQFTAAFDAVDRSLQALEPYSDGGAVVFVTDGRDTVGDAELDSPEQVAQAESLGTRAEQQGVVVSAVNIEQEGTPFSDAFRSIARISGGDVGTVRETADLVPELTAELEEVVGEALPTPDLADPDASAAPVASVAPTTEATVAALPPPSSAEPWPREVAWGAAGGMFAAAVIGGLVLSGIAGRASSPEVRRQKALDVYSPIPDRPAPRAPAAPTRLGDNALARQAVDVAGRLIDRGDAEVRLAKRLEGADLALRPGEWVVIQAVISVVLGLVLLILTLGNPLAALIGVALGIAGTTVFLRLRADRRQRAFHAALPDTLQLLASTLRVGHSLPQAMDSVVREGREPIRTEFQRALVEARLGVPAEKSLDDIAERVGSEDFRWVVMSIRIQREVGGNLAELLDTVAETIRERERLRRHVSALSAEGRLSAWIVGALPVVFIVYLLIARPGYLSPLVTDPLGIFFLVLAVVLFTAGVFGLRWATKVEL